MSIQNTQFCNLQSKKIRVLAQVALVLVFRAVPKYVLGVQSQSGALPWSQVVWPLF